MVAGLPWTTWLLLAAAVAPGLGLAIAFYRVHRDDHRPLDYDGHPGRPSGLGER